MKNPLICYLQLFGDISAADQEVIEAAMQFREVKEGEVLGGGGKICRELFFICNGVLRIVKEDNDTTYFFLRDNQFCTILFSFINQVPANDSIRAACDSEIIALHHDTLEELYIKMPYLKVIINEIIQKGLLDKIQLTNAYQGLDSTARYKQFILSQPEVALRVPVRDIASYIGVTPQSLSRIRKNIS